MVIGPVLSVVTGLLIQILGLGTWGWVIPPVLTLLYGVVRRLNTQLASRQQPAKSEPVNRGTIWALSLAAVVGVLSLVPNVSSYPLTITGIANRFHPDMYFFEALSTSINRFGPFQSIFSPGDEVRYHWLVYAWSGQVTVAADASSFVALTRVLPFVAIAASCMIAIAWVERLTKVRWAPSLAVLLLISGGYVGATYGAIFNFDSPSQAMTAAWLLAFGFAVIELLSEEQKSKFRVVGSITLIGLLSAALTGGKISSGIEALTSIAFVTVVGFLFHRSWWKRSAFATLASLAGFVASYIVVVAGSADPGQLRFGEFWNRASSVQGLNPIPGNLGIALGTAFLILAICFRWFGVLWLVGNKPTRLNPSTLFGAGLALTSLVAIIVLSSGLNETWFALGASAPLAALSAVGAAESLNSLKLQTNIRRVVLALTLSCSMVLFIGVSKLWLTGPSGGNDWVSTLRWSGPIVGLIGAGLIGLGLVLAFRSPLQSLKGWAVVSIITCVFLSIPGRLLGVGLGQVGEQAGLRNDAFGPVLPFVVARDQREIQAWSKDQAAAVTWLKTASNPFDLLATNITFGAFIPAVTGLHTFASALNYQAQYGPRDMVQPLVTRENQSWDFIDSPDAATAQPLCDAGVRWLWVDPERSHRRDWGSLATIVYSNSSVIILELNRLECK